MVGLHLLMPLVQLFTWPLRIVAGGNVLAGGITLNIRAHGLFKRAGTSVKPFEPTTALIVEGPFAFSRHPMYLGMVLILIGSGFALGSRSPWLVVPVFVCQINRRFIAAEEAKLEATFGSRYLGYKRKVRRWL
jgi:protein-S-isoprenylcysteine O-methyltransferase Ste14